MKAILFTAFCLACRLASAQDAGHVTTWSKAGDVAGFEVRSGEIEQVSEDGHPGGFLRVTNTSTIVPKPYLRSHLGKVFGSKPGTISFDLRVMGDGHIASAGIFLSTGNQAFRFTVAATKVLSHEQTAADGWVHYSIPWKADWSESEAIAAGWVPFGGKADHWLEVINNPIWSQLDVTYVAGKGTAAQILGLDNFHIEAGEVLDASRRRLIEPPPPQDAPVAQFAFDEGSGDFLHDRSGNHPPARIQGASWVRMGARWALEFDGQDDFVDCGEVRVFGPQTLVIWAYAEPIYSVFLGVPIAGDGSCQLTQHVHDMRGTGSGFLPFRKWTHIAQVWDGKVARLYIDGVLASVVTAQEPASRANFLLAGPRRKAPNEPADFDRRFRGKIASVALYNRALTSDGILDDLRTSNITGSVLPMPIPQPGLGRIKVELDAARTGQPWDKLAVDVEVVKSGGNERVLPLATVREWDHLGRAVVDLAAPALPPGSYVVRTSAKGADGEAIGIAGEEPIAWTGSAQFPSGPQGARKLNNLVTELLSITGPSPADATFRFVNPRVGFVYFSNRGAQALTLTHEDSKTVTELALARDFGEIPETVRYLPAGSYALSAPRSVDLTVRAVAQTVYDYAHTELPVNHPGYVGGFGPYHGAFEERHAFPHYNTLFVHDFNIEKPFVKVWKAKGRRILVDLNGGQVKPNAGQSFTDAIVEALGEKLLGFKHPLYDGFLFDEWGGSTPIQHDWAQAVERLYSRPQLQQRALHMWSYAIYDMVTYAGGREGRELTTALQKHHSPLQWECYLDSQRTELAAWRHIHNKLVGEIQATEQISPGFVQNLIVAPYAYVNAGPPWLTMTQPSYDVRTYIEMQIRTMATDPAFAGIKGLAVYRSTYADEEIIRWTARLMRHYAIEGHTEPLGRYPYALGHIQNGDFEVQDPSWKFESAEKNSIRYDMHHQLGSTQGRYTGNQGDTVLITRRSAKAPNVFWQEIQDLEPGRLYSFRMFTADHRDLSKQVEHPLRIEFQNAELVPEKCFTHIGLGRRPAHFLNWHVRVFRALGPSATLRVSDWTSAEQPGGAIGQELMHNFIKVQPYWASP